MTDTRDVSNLLGRAGFTLLTVDIDEVRVSYPSMWELVDDLRDMGEGNAVIGRRGFLRRDTLLAASSIYSALHGSAEGTVPATFQVIFFVCPQALSCLIAHTDCRLRLPGSHHQHNQSHWNVVQDQRI
jgi:NADH dehydrogenase [ubiquinone] 1 alpha subcomplex assembly factor 5